MPGPTTEILNDDIKELRKEFKADFKELKDEIQHVAVGLAELRTEVRLISGVAKWAGALLVTTILTSGFAGIWWASGIDAKVGLLEARMDEEFAATNARIDKLEASIGDKIDKLEASIAKVLDQARPPQPATKAVVTP